jgi:hypothetical protein
MALREVTLRTINMRSVARVSVVLYACFVLVFVVAWIILWAVAGVLGVTANVEDFIAKLFALDSFSFSIIAQALAIIVGGPVFIALGTGASALAVTFYNLIAELTGGVRIEVEDDE